MKSHISRILLVISVLLLSVQFQSLADHIIYIASPSNGATFNISPSQETVNITFQIQKRDGVGPIDRVDYKLDNGDLLPLMCSGNYCYPPFDHTLSVGPGQHTYTIVGYRYAGGYWIDVAAAQVTFTCIKYYGITVQNSFGGGSVTVDGNSYSSGVSFTWASGENHTAQTGETQTYGNYVRHYRDWTVPTGNAVIQPIQIPASLNFTYTANFRKDFNIAFQNGLPGASSGGVIKVNGTQYSAPSSTFVVREDNTITGEDLYQVIDNVEYTFSSWSPGGSTSASTTFTPGDHTTYTANFNAKPLPPPNLSVGGSVGNPVQITWSQHPSSGVTQFQIWRKVKHQGSQSESSPELLTTVGSSTTSYTDNDYLVTSGYTHDLVWYDIRAYFSPTSTYADQNYLSAFAQENGKRTGDKNRQTMVTSELPMEYSATAYPNPFNPSTTISYQLAEQAQVTLTVYDMMGREIATLVQATQSAGYHAVQWHGRDARNSPVASGIYMYRLNAIPNSGKQAVLLSGKLLLSK